MTKVAIKNEKGEIEKQVKSGRISEQDAKSKLRRQNIGFEKFTLADKQDKLEAIQDKLDSLNNFISMASNVNESVKAQSKTPLSDY